MAGKQTALSELVDRLIEAQCKIQKSFELVLQQESVDIKDDDRRDKFRKRQDDYIDKIKKLNHSKDNERLENTIKNYESFLEREYEIEDIFEKEDDNLRTLNLKKLDEAIEELRRTTRDFEQESIQEIIKIREKKSSLVTANN